MSKLSSYQKLKAKVKVLEKDMRILVTEEGKIVAKEVKFKYGVIYDIEKMIWHKRKI